MKTTTTLRTLIAAALFGTLSAGALAQPISQGELLSLDAVAAGPMRSLADVRAEAAAAVADGRIAHGELGAPVEPFYSTRTLADVKAETLMAVKQQLIPYGEAPLVEPTAMRATRVVAAR